MKRLALVVATVTLISACGGEHPAKACVREGGEWISVAPIYIRSGDVSIPIDNSFCSTEVTS